MVQNITPTELSARLDSGEDMLIVDIREHWELQINGLKGAVHIPLGDFPAALRAIPEDKPVVIICHTGRRSAYLVDWLDMQGYTNVLNLAGGLDRWAREVDPSLPRY
jgi:rhodanese-related sulfurtransferase